MELFKAVAPSTYISGLATKSFFSKRRLCRLEVKKYNADAFKYEFEFVMGGKLLIYA